MILENVANLLIFLILYVWECFFLEKYLIFV